MQITREFLVLMMISAIASQEFDQSPQLHCSYKVINQIREIDISIATEGFLENRNISQLQKLGEFLICCHLSNGFTNQSKNYQGVITLEQLKNQYLINILENQYIEASKFLNDLDQLDIFQSKTIQYTIQLNFVKESNNLQNLSINLKLQQESNFQKEFNTKLDLQEEEESRNSQFAIINYIIVCATITFLQCLQIKTIKDFLKQIKVNPLQMGKKMLTLPLFFQIIIELGFCFSLGQEIAAVEKSSTNMFFIYFIPFFTQLGIQCFLIPDILFLLLNQKEWVKKCLQNVWYAFLIIMAQFPFVGLTIVFFYFFNDNLYYQYSFPYVYLPQIIYNFKFHTLQFNWKFLLGQLIDKIFYIVYFKSSTLSPRDTDFNLWVSLIDCTGFLIQLLIFYLQNRYGPKNLIYKCKFWRKRKTVLLWEQDDDICPICKGQIHDVTSNQYARGLIVTNCQHTFHYSCLQNWCEGKNFCPLCEQILTASICE